MRNLQLDTNVLYIRAGNSFYHRYIAESVLLPKCVDNTIPGTSEQIEKTNIDLIKKLIDEVKQDINTRYPRLQENFTKSLKTFQGRYNLDI
jgi:hypothetical protein